MSLEPTYLDLYQRAVRDLNSMESQKNNTQENLKSSNHKQNQHAKAISFLNQRGAGDKMKIDQPNDDIHINRGCAE